MAQMAQVPAQNEIMHKSLISQAIILSAGESSRFWPLNEGGHKSFLRIAGKPIIQWTIDSLAKSGIVSIIVVCSPAHKKWIESSIICPKGCALKMAVQDEPKGMGDAILNAKKYIAGPFFVANAAHFDAGKLAEMALKTPEAGKQAIVFGRKTSAPWIYGILKMSGGFASGIAEKPKKGTEPSDIRAVGMYALAPGFLKLLKSVKEGHYSFEDALDSAMKEKPAKVIMLEEETPTLKYPWDLLAVSKGVLAHFFAQIQKQSANPAVLLSIAPTAQIDPSAKITGCAYIGEGTKVLENAVIKGPCYIGNNSTIGTNAVIRDNSCIGDNAVIGANAEIARSVILDNTHMHSGFVGDSIIAEGCRIGAGFITGNVRIDRGEIQPIVNGEKMPTGLKSFGAAVGKNTRIGIGVKTMPGVLIGANCKIGPGTVVNENVASDTAYYSEFKGIVKKKKAR